MSIADSQTHQVGKFAFAEMGKGFGGTTAGANKASASITMAVVNSDGSTATVTGAISLASGIHSGKEITQALVDAFNTKAQTDMTDIRASIVEATGSSASKPQYTIRFDSAGDLTGTDIKEGINDGIDSTTAANTTANLTNSLSTIDVTTRRDAELAIMITDHALRDVDKTRSDIGSVQNQLESTIRNISVTRVNVTAAESQIRDVDFALESAKFSKLNILAQSGTYALSQANAVQQNVLKLLQ
jgi:flagellin